VSKLQIRKTNLDGVLEILPTTNFEDFRGTYVEIYNEELFREAGLNQDFTQDDISTSYKGVLRGIHGDSKTWKLISCLKGSFYLVVINNDSSSTEFGKWEGFTLSETNRKQILVPPKFGNGHLVISESAIFHYKQTTYYNREDQFTLMWNDKNLNIWWPTDSPILSERDSGF
jgi:dTDP-4-dehydrorhamnose 3,5-epimerase